ncbi:bacteriophage T4 gp5 trimerisation domain-containing protein, partial [Pseudomonas sp. QD4]|uniref:bacteriophage T4 gp5 trimerisation domain-containing protein n=1 Tax=Pseudomonas sp. QD4 TaxID=3368618 RepID=UPI003B9DC77F
ETTFVGHDRSEQVEHDETVSIGHDRKETVGNNEQVNIGQDRRHDIGQDDSLSIGRNHSIRTGKDRTEEVGNHRRDKTTANHWVSIGGHQELTIEGRSELQAGQAIRHRSRVIELQAGEVMRIRGPGGTITLDSGGITLSAVAISIKGPLIQQGGDKGNSLALEGNPEDGLPADETWNWQFTR